MPTKEEDEKILKCESCKCKWFEHVTVKQYDALHNVVFGQKVPYYSDMEFYLLRCLKCGKLVVPSVNSSRADKTWKEWNNMLDDLSLNKDPLDEFQANQFKPISSSGDE